MIMLVRGYEEKFEYNTEFYELRAVLSTKGWILLSNINIIPL